MVLLCMLCSYLLTKITDNTLVKKLSKLAFCIMLWTGLDLNYGVLKSHGENLELDSIS